MCNQYSCDVLLNITVREQTKLIGKLVSATNKSNLAGVFLQANIGWGIYRLHKDIIPIDLKSIPKGDYILILDNNGTTTEYPFQVK